MLLDIRPDHLALVQGVLQRWVADKEVWAFGSRAKWTAKDYSDLDLCIVTQAPLPFEVMGHLQEDFAESDLPYKVDLVDWSSVSVSFRTVIERDKVVVQRPQKAGAGGGGMGSESRWDTLSLKAAGVTLIDCDHRTPVAADAGYPYIAIPQLKDGHIALDGVRRISQSDYDEWTKKLTPQANDVIVVRRCNSGDSAHVPEGLKCAIGQNLVVLRADGSKVLPQYLRWLVRGTEWWDEVAKYINVGAVFDSLRCRDIPNFELPIPPIEEQRQIAATLAEIDDRITLLRETNATLEAIAQALFKSWFVDFDPVRAKMEGRVPEGMDEATAALFPDALVESELGLVPEGWQAASVYGIAKVTYGAPFASKLFKSEPPGKPLVRIRDLKDERPGVYTEEVHPKGYLLRPGDITVGMDGEFRAYVWGGEPAWLNQRVCVFHPINGACSAFVRFSIAPLLAAVEASETATTVIHLGKNDIDRFKVVMPLSAILSAFAEVANPLYERLVANKQQAQTLATLRDTLLPRLISGQLRLPEAQAAAEEALA